MESLLKLGFPSISSKGLKRRMECRVTGFANLGYLQNVRHARGPLTKITGQVLRDSHLGFRGQGLGFRVQFRAQCSDTV